MSNMNGIVHNFQRSLQTSQELSIEADWVAFYKRIWPEAVHILRVDRHCEIQTRGIDRMIWLPSDKQITIDEKLRTKDYGDILIETCSVGSLESPYVCKKPGWAVDPGKFCDFIAYAVPSRSKCYLLPFELLRAAVIHNQARWSAKFGERYAKNPGYRTASIPVPWDDLRAAICQQMHRQFNEGHELPPVSPSSTGQQMVFDW